jgi:tRNA(His) 5'-end guanylyltransferase
MAFTDSLGDRMKSYEFADTQRKAFKGQPIVARLDGKGFHTFCKGLKKPFDERLHKLMRRVMGSLMERFGANLGYTQSDEITLVWFVDSTSASEYVFDGRFQKMDSLLAAWASAVFNRELQSFILERGGTTEIFDCRSFVVPNLLEAYHAVLWRQQDCTKNAISMAAQSMFSHKSLQGMSGPEMIERMQVEREIAFAVDYPIEFRLGTFARRVKRVAPLSAETIEKLKNIGRGFDPATEVERSETQFLSLLLRDLENPVEFLLKGGLPSFKADAGNITVST